MKSPIVQSEAGITLAGGGPFGRRDLALCLARAPVAVAADGGADRLLRLGTMPRAVIGDMDSISDAARARIPIANQHLVPEQSTTDFDKALRLVEAPVVLALGFAGARLDHGLAAMHTLVNHPDRRCILVGPKDVAVESGDRVARGSGIRCAGNAGDPATTATGRGDQIASACSRAVSRSRWMM